MNALIKILIYSLLLICCKSTEKKDENHIKTFNLKELPKMTSVRLSDLGFEDIEYIPLETTENCLVDNINEINVGDRFYLIKSSSTIFKFQNNGSFVTKIGTIGRGPKEFTVAHDVEIYNDNHEIYIVSAWQKKFNVYSETGDFLRTFNCPLNTTNFAVTYDGLLCYNMNSMGNVETSYNLIDFEGKVIKDFSNKYYWNYKQQSMYVYQSENLFYRFDNHLFKKEVYSDTVYVFENMNFNPHLVIDVGKKLVTTNARSELNPIELAENYLTPWNLFEFGDYVYYEFGYGFKIGGNNLIYGFIGSKSRNFESLINAEQGIINDLDGGPSIWPKTIKDDKIILGWISALKLKDHVACPSFKNSAPKYPEKKKELEKLASGLKETDNPVLVLVRLKK